MTVTLSWGLSFTVELALSAATGSYGIWNTGLWDTATWGPDIVWTDVSQWVRGISTARRFSRDARAWQPGTASIVLNNQDGRFSAANLSGPYVTGGITQIRPWRPARIRMTWAGTTYSVFYGYAIDWQETWDVPRVNGGKSTVTVQCVDEFGSLARVDGVAMPLDGAGETSGQRIHRILDNAGHTGLRDVDTGRMTMQATDLSGNAVQDLQLTADSEGGAVYVEADGTVVFRDVYDLVETTRSNTVQAIFGDNTGELAYADAAVEHNGDLLANIATYTRKGGAAVTSLDATSRALYGDKRDARTDLMCETDTQVQTLSDLWVQRFKDPELRITSMTLKPRRDTTNLMPQALGRLVRDLIRVRRRPPGGWTLSQDVYISGISHLIEVGPQNLTTVFDLTSSQPWTSFTTSRFNVGLWDTATWFY